MEKASIPMRSQYELPSVLAAPSASEIDELAERSESLEQRIASLNDSYETLKKREVELTEWRWVLREAGGFFDRVYYAHPRRLRLLLTFTFRLMVTPMRFASLPTMTKLRFCRTSSSSPEAKMGMFKRSSRSP